MNWIPIGASCSDESRPEYLIAHERQTAIAELAQGVSHGARAITKVTEAMDGLKSRLADTGEIVKVIKKVASQTGLLAINASIETLGGVTTS